MSERALIHQVKDSAVQRALRALERRINELQLQLTGDIEEAGGGGGVTLPIAESDVTNLVSDLAGKAPLSHTHVKADVTDFAHTHAQADVTNLVSDLAAKVPTTRTITATSPIRIDGGGSADLSANRTLSLLYDEVLGGMFSSGVDGAVDFDGVTTPVAGATLSGSTYTLTRDVNATTINVATGVLVQVDGYRVFASGNIHLAGTARIGNPGSAGAPGTAVAHGAGGSGSTARIVSGRIAGGGTAAGSNANPAPQGFLAGVSTGGTSPAANPGNPGGGPGRGGGGGGASSGGSTGFSGGTVTLASAAEGSIDNLFQAIFLRGVSASTTVRYQSGTGGGGGASGVSPAFGGGGGSSGGGVVVCGKSFSGPGSLDATGGDGAAGNAGGGGGGGGSGGLIVVVISTGSFPTCTVAGGAGGTGGGGGAGGAGGDGLVRQFRIGAA